MSHQHWNYAARMRDQGFRVTPQRQLILDAVCEAGEHTTLAKVYERVHAKVPAVNRATVYRNLDFLCEMRLVVATQIGRKMYYEIAGETPHHHLVCRACGKIERISHETVQALFSQIEHEQKFTVDMDHLSLFGVCDQCRHAGATGGSLPPSHHSSQWRHVL